jgi:hypothetical protein
VQIEPGQAGAEQLIAAIQQAGYTPVAIESTVGSAVAAGAPARKGGCCG